MDFRLRKSELIRGHNSFSRILVLHQSIAIDPVKCFFKIVDGIPPFINSVGFIVKGHRCAVERNKYRRLLREAFRQSKSGFNRSCLESNSHFLLVFMVDAIIAGSSRSENQQIHEAVSKILGRLSSGIIL